MPCKCGHFMYMHEYNKDEKSRNKCRGSDEHLGGIKYRHTTCNCKEYVSQ